MQSASQGEICSHSYRCCHTDTTSQQHAKSTTRRDLLTQLQVLPHWHRRCRSKLAISPSHGTLTLDQPVLGLTLWCRVLCRKHIEYQLASHWYNCSRSGKDWSPHLPFSRRTPYRWLGQGRSSQRKVGMAPLNSILMADKSKLLLLKLRSRYYMDIFTTPICDPAMSSLPHLLSHRNRIYFSSADNDFRHTDIYPETTALVVLKSFITQTQNTADWNRNNSNKMIVTITIWLP